MIRNQESIKAQLLDIFFKQQSFEKMLNSISILIGNPLIVCDKSFRIVSSSDPQNITDIFWQDHVKIGYCSYEFISSVHNLEAVQKGKMHTDAYLVYCQESNDYKYVCSIIGEDRTELGIIILLDSMSAFQSGDQELLKLVAKMVGQKLQKKVSYHSNHSIIAEDILYDLLESKWSEEELKRRMKMTKFEWPDNLQIMVLDISDYYQKSEELYPSDLKKVIYEEWHCPVSICYNDNVVLLFDHQRCLDIIEKAENFLHKKQVFIGISRPFTRPAELRYYYLQAIRAIRIGRNMSVEKKLYQYHEIAFLAVLPQLSLTEAYKEFAHPAIQRLNSYDSDHQTDLLHIFYQYLVHKENVNETADSLFVHRNTLRYKVQKALTVGVINDLNSFELADILLSYRILHFYQEKATHTGISFSNSASRNSETTGKNLEKICQYQGECAECTATNCTFIQQNISN